MASLLRPPLNYIKVDPFSIDRSVGSVEIDESCLGFYSEISFIPLDRRADFKAFARFMDQVPLAAIFVDQRTLQIVHTNTLAIDLARQLGGRLPIASGAAAPVSIDLASDYPFADDFGASEVANLPRHARIEFAGETVDLKISPIKAGDDDQLGLMLSWAVVAKEVAVERGGTNVSTADALTGLATRVTVHEAIESRLHGREKLSLLVIGIGGLKRINENHGHRAGDELLRQVARRLQQCSDTQDVTLARYSGSAFIMLLPDLPVARIEWIATRIIDALERPFTLGRGIVDRIDTAIGIVAAPDHGNAVDDLIGRANIALDCARDAGGSRWARFGYGMEGRIQDRRKLRALLDMALGSGQGLFVFYQPIVDLKSGAITAREALIRWHVPTRGWILPADFIPLAEQNGMIDRISAFVLKTACLDAASWPDTARVAVNVSASQLGKEFLVDMVQDALVAANLPADRLEVEVTETAVLGDEQAAIDDLHRLRDMGVRVALDDFGTGYSSLTQLCAFPFDKIKIDGSFVKGATRPECAAILRLVVDLGHRLDVLTVAEGIETAEQMHAVVETGCSEGQGFFLGRPAPSARSIDRVRQLDAIFVSSETPRCWPPTGPRDTSPAIS